MEYDQSITLQKMAPSPMMGPMQRLEAMLTHLDEEIDHLSVRLQPVLDDVSDTAPGGTPQEAPRSQFDDLLNTLQYRIDRLQGLSRRLVL